MLNEFYDKYIKKETSIPYASQEEYIISKSIVNEVIVKEDLSVDEMNLIHNEPVYKLKRTTCPECDSYTFLRDYRHGEIVCSGCGLVLNENLSEIPEDIHIKQYHYDNLTSEERKIIKKNHGREYYYTKKQDWNRQQQKRIMERYTSLLEMNKLEKEYVNHIIDVIGYKRLHSRCCYETIIAGVCRFVLKNRSNINYTHLRFNYSIFNDLLTRKEYEVIEGNILENKDQLMHWYTKK